MGEHGSNHNMYGVLEVKGSTARTLGKGNVPVAEGSVARTLKLCELCLTEREHDSNPNMYQVPAVKGSMALP